MDCSVFDPDKVYLQGTLQEGASYLDAICAPETPDAFCVGFGSPNPSNSNMTASTHRRPRVS